MVNLCEISCDEKKTIEELRMRTKSILTANMYDDTLHFYRFLKARDFNVDEAEKMLRKHVEWRKLHQIDTILEDFKPMEFFTKYIDFTAFGFCKEGSLVIYSPPGKLEMRDILKCSEFNRYMRHFSWQAEKLIKLIPQQDEVSGRNDLKITMIMDMDKLTFANATYRASIDEMIGITNLYQNNYPECMKAVYIINAPTYAMIAFAIVKAIMSNVMIQKIHIFGNDGWKETLLEKIDADIMPAFLGGNRTDPDGNPLCKTFVNHGGTISPDYFLPDEKRYFKNRPGVKKVTVPKMDKREIALEVREVGSLIRWEFYCRSSINFGLFRVSSKESPEEVIPLTRYDTSDGTEKHYYKVRIPGKYILVFDNSFSWISSKEIEYCTEVLKPES